MLKQKVLNQVHLILKLVEKVIHIFSFDTVL